VIIDANDVETGIGVVGAQDLAWPAVGPLGSVANDGEGLPSSRVADIDALRREWWRWRPKEGVVLRQGEGGRSPCVPLGVRLTLRDR
jgi:hypothetical protein